MTFSSTLPLLFHSFGPIPHWHSWLPFTFSYHYILHIHHVLTSALSYRFPFFTTISICSSSMKQNHTQAQLWSLPRYDLFANCLHTGQHQFTATCFHPFTIFRLPFNDSLTFTTSPSIFSARLIHSLPKLSCLHAWPYFLPISPIPRLTPNLMSTENQAQLLALDA